MMFGIAIRLEAKLSTKLYARLKTWNSENLKFYFVLRKSGFQLVLTFMLTTVNTQGSQITITSVSLFVRAKYRVNQPTASTY